MKGKLGLLAAVTLTALPSPSSASVVTFTGIPTGTLVGSRTEDGVTYSGLLALGGGTVAGNQNGNPGGELEGGALFGGVAVFVPESGGLFTFQGLDYAALEAEFPAGTSGSQTLTVNGYVGGILIGTDTFTLNNAPFSSPYANWTTFNAVNLAGVQLDQLQIGLNNSSFLFTSSLQAIDNVRFGFASSVPEPATWTLMILGFGMIGSSMRVRRRRKAAFVG